MDGINFVGISKEHSVAHYNITFANFYTKGYNLFSFFLLILMRTVNMVSQFLAVPGVIKQMEAIK